MRTRIYGCTVIAKRCVKKQQIGIKYILEVILKRKVLANAYQAKSLSVIDKKKLFLYYPINIYIDVTQTAQHDALRHEMVPDVHNVSI